MKRFILAFSLALTACGGNVYIEQPPVAPTPTPTPKQQVISQCGDMRVAALAATYKDVTGFDMPCGTFVLADANRVSCPGVGPCLSYIEGTDAGYTIYVAHARYPDGGEYRGIACTALTEALIFAQFHETRGDWQRNEWMNAIMDRSGCQYGGE